jgi:N-acetylgalactosamine-N,N'-diacetylbacillosaminyl-diphospho-undecaprenol 4-alpha-N-acetylgalactosaminyltransferase
MTKTPVSILLYSLCGGGAERVAALLCRALADRFDITLVLMNDHIDYDLPAGQKILYLERSQPDEAGLLKLLKIPLLAWRYARLCRQYGFTASLSLMSRPNLINALSKRLGNPARTLLSERAMPSLQYGYGDLQSVIMRALIRRLYPLADRISANSHGNALDLTRNFGITKPITVIHNPIDLKAIDALKDDPIELPPHRPLFVSVGRLDAGKNHALMIRVFKAAAPESAALLILGTGPLQNDLQKLIDQLDLADRVHLKGFDPNPYRTLARADAFLFTSRHEGFPNVLLEALACGLPVISTDCPSGPREILAPDTPAGGHLKSGWEAAAFGVLVAVDDEAAFADALARAPLESYRAKARLRAADFDLKRTALAFAKELNG